MIVLGHSHRQVQSSVAEPWKNYYFAPRNSIAFCQSPTQYFSHWQWEKFYCSQMSTLPAWNDVCITLHQNTRWKTRLLLLFWKNREAVNMISWNYYCQEMKNEKKRFNYYNAQNCYCVIDTHLLTCASYIEKMKLQAVFASMAKWQMSHAYSSIHYISTECIYVWKGYLLLCCTK